VPRLHTTAPVMGAREWLLLLLLSVLWGGSFFFAEVALAALPPFTLVFARVALAVLALMLLCGVAGCGPWQAPQLWGAFLIMGALNNVLPFSLIFWGQTRIDSGLAAILNATTPFFTALLAQWLTADERLSPGKLSGIALGVAGVAVMLGPQVLGGLGAELWAQLAVLAGALSYALAGIYGRRFAGRPPMQVAAGQLGASSLLILPVVLWLEQPWQLALPAAHIWVAVAALALVSTALAYVIYFRILATAGATNLLLVTLLIPVSAVLLGAGILDERLEATQLAGMALIALGLLQIDGRIWRWRRAAPARS